MLDAVSHALQPPYHVQCEFPWPKNASALYRQNAIVCSVQDLPSHQTELMALVFELHSTYFFMVCKIHSVGHFSFLEWKLLLYRKLENGKIVLSSPISPPRTVDHQATQLVVNVFSYAEQPDHTAQGPLHRKRLVLSSAKVDTRTNKGWLHPEGLSEICFVWLLSSKWSNSFWFIDGCSSVCAGISRNGYKQSFKYYFNVEYCVRASYRINAYSL